MGTLRVWFLSTLLVLQYAGPTDKLSAGCADLPKSACPSDGSTIFHDCERIGHATGDCTGAAVCTLKCDSGRSLFFDKNGDGGWKKGYANEEATCAATGPWKVTGATTAENFNLIPDKTIILCAKPGAPPGGGSSTVPCGVNCKAADVQKTALCDAKEGCIHEAAPYAPVTTAGCMTVTCPGVGFHIPPGEGAQEKTLTCHPDGKWYSGDGIYVVDMLDEAVCVKHYECHKKTVLKTDCSHPEYDFGNSGCVTDPSFSGADDNQRKCPIGKNMFVFDDNEWKHDTRNEITCNKDDGSWKNSLETVFITHVICAEKAPTKIKSCLNGPDKPDTPDDTWLDGGVEKVDLVDGELLCKPPIANALTKELYFRKDSGVWEKAEKIECDAKTGKFKQGTGGTYELTVDDSVVCAETLPKDINPCLVSFPKSECPNNPQAKCQPFTTAVVDPLLCTSKSLFVDVRGDGVFETGYEQIKCDDDGDWQAIKTGVDLVDPLTKASKVVCAESDPSIPCDSAQMKTPNGMVCDCEKVTQGTATGSITCTAGKTLFIKKGGVGPWTIANPIKCDGTTGKWMDGVKDTEVAADDELICAVSEPKPQCPPLTSGDCTQVNKDRSTAACEPFSPPRDGSAVNCPNGKLVYMRAAGGTWATEAGVSCHLDATNSQWQKADGTPIASTDEFICASSNPNPSNCPALNLDCTRANQDSPNVQCKPPSQVNDNLVCDPQTLKLYYSNGVNSPWFATTTIWCDPSDNWLHGDDNEAFYWFPTDVMCAAADPTPPGRPCVWHHALQSHCLPHNKPDCKPQTDQAFFDKGDLSCAAEPGTELYYMTTSTWQKDKKITCDSHWWNIEDTLVPVHIPLVVTCAGSDPSKLSCVSTSPLSSSCDGVDDGECAMVVPTDENTGLVCPPTSAPKSTFLFVLENGQWTQTTSIKCELSDGKWREERNQGDTPAIMTSTEVICAASKPTAPPKCTAPPYSCTDPTCEAPINADTKPRCNTGKKLYFKETNANKFMEAISIACKSDGSYEVKYKFQYHEKINKDKYPTLANVVCADSNPEPDACAFAVDVTVDPNSFKSQSGEPSNSVKFAAGTAAKCGEDEDVMSDKDTKTPVVGVVCYPDGKWKLPVDETNIIEYDKLMCAIRIQSCSRQKDCSGINDCTLPVGGSALRCDSTLHLYYKVEANDKYLKAESAECNNQKWTIKYKYNEVEKVKSDVPDLANAVCSGSNPDPDACKFGSFDASFLPTYELRNPAKLQAEAGEKADCSETIASPSLAQDLSANREAICDEKGIWRRVSDNAEYGTTIGCFIEKSKACKEPQPDEILSVQNIAGPPKYMLTSRLELTCEIGATFAIKAAGRTEFQYYRKIDVGDPIKNRGSIICSNQAKWELDDNSGAVVEKMACTTKLLCLADNFEQVKLAKCADENDFKNAAIGCEEAKTDSSNNKERLFCPTSGKKLLIKKGAQDTWTELKSSEVFCNDREGQWEIETADETEKRLDNVPANSVICADGLPTTTTTMTTVAPGVTDKAAPGSAGCDVCRGSLAKIFSPCDGCSVNATSTKMEEGAEKCTLTLAGTEYTLIANDAQQSKLVCSRSDGKWMTDAGVEVKQISARLEKKPTENKPKWAAASTGLIVASVVLIIAIGAGFVLIYIRKRKKITNEPKERGVTRKYDPNIIAKKQSKVSKKRSKKNSGASKESIQSKVEENEDA